MAHRVRVPIKMRGTPDYSVGEKRPTGRDYESNVKGWDVRISPCHRWSMGAKRVHNLESVERCSCTMHRLYLELNAYKLEQHLPRVKLYTTS